MAQEIYIKNTKCIPQKILDEMDNLVCYRWLRMGYNDFRQRWRVFNTKKTNVRTSKEDFLNERFLTQLPINEKYGLVTMKRGRKGNFGIIFTVRLTSSKTYELYLQKKPFLPKEKTYKKEINTYIKVKKLRRMLEEKYIRNRLKNV